jgi:hypothetical protein
MLSQENKKRLENYRRQIEIWHTDRSIQMDISVICDIENIIRTIEPGYTVMKWCQSCVGAMLDKSFKLLQS